MLCQRCRVAIIATRRVMLTRSASITTSALAATVRRSHPSRLLAQSTVFASRRYSTPSEAAESSSGKAEAAAKTNSPKTLEKPDYLDDAESAIWDKLVAEFAPTELQVQDISGGCGSMYGIEIASEKFQGLNMLKQQRMVNAVLGDDMKGWHGLQLRTRVP